ncbi:MAG: carboxypeptidase-like regulatory domain-containing protein [Saprospiraceae bacterium]
MKKLILCIITICFFLGKINAQTPFTVEGVIIDAKTNSPLEKVNIFNQTSSLGDFSNLDGTFQIEIKKYPTVIIFSYIGYENFLLELEKEPTEPINIKLQPSSFGLPEIEITAQPKIEKLTNKSFTVKDFLLVENKILILTYADMFTGNKLILQNWQGELLDELSLKKVKVNNLHQGCLGNIHLLGKNHGYEISLIDNKILFLSKYPKKQFEKLIKPCVESSKDFIYRSKHTVRDQILTYQIFSKEEKKVLHTLRVIDELNLRRSKDDFVLQRQLGIPITWGQIQAWNNLMYKPIYSPLLNLGEEICLFNHIAGYLEFLTHEGKNKRYIPITYHQNKKWHQQILFDKKNNKVYTAFNTTKGKTIHRINLINGTTQLALHLECNFVEKMLIEDGYLFYLESGKISSERNRILQRVKLEE